MAVVGTIKVDIKPVKEMLRKKGLDVNGDVQQQHTQNVLRRIQRYMPKRTGFTIDETIAHSPISGAEINTFTRYARYLHEGKVMVNAKTGKGPSFIPGIGFRWRGKGVKLKETDRLLNYTRSKSNPEAGPYWGKRLMEKEGDIMLQELKNYVSGRSDSP